jgi:hypothetical protein
MEPVVIVDLVDEPRKVLDDVGEGFIGQPRAMNLVLDFSEIRPARGGAPTRPRT